MEVAPEQISLMEFLDMRVVPPIYDDIHGKITSYVQGIGEI